MDPNDYKIGNTKVFFKAGVLGNLEDMRDERLSRIVALFQAWVRGYNMKKQYKRLEDQRYLNFLYKMLISECFFYIYVITVVSQYGILLHIYMLFLNIFMRCGQLPLNRFFNYFILICFALLYRTALSKIQSNIRKWMGMRNWPWWKLYVKVSEINNTFL